MRRPVYPLSGEVGQFVQAFRGGGRFRASSRSEVMGLICAETQPSLTESRPELRTRERCSPMGPVASVML